MKIFSKQCIKCNKHFKTKTENRNLCLICINIINGHDLKIKNCIYCKKEFSFLKKKALYCTIKCRNDHSHSIGKYIDFRKSSVKNSLLTVLWGARSRSKRRNTECTITDSDILELYDNQKGLCAQTGIKLEPSKQEGFKNKNPYTISIDRIDNTKGYIKGNVQLVCTIFNLFKNSYNIEDVTKICKEYIKYNNIDINE